MRLPLALCCVALLVAPLAASAQIEAGRVIDDSTHAPLAGLRVSLLTAAADGWTRIDTTRTDRNGLFQFILARPGIYRVGFVSAREPLFLGAVDTLADSIQQHEFALPVVRSRDSRVYLESEVDVPVAAERGAHAPEYPPGLRSRGINGGVAVQFVVTPDGRADTTTFKVLAASDSAFAEAVRRNLPRMRFFPGTIGGVKVRQMVQQQFFFNVGQ